MSRQLGAALVVLAWFPVGVILVDRVVQDIWLSWRPVSQSLLLLVLVVPMCRVEGRVFTQAGWLWFPLDFASAAILFGGLLAIFGFESNGITIAAALTVVLAAWAEELAFRYLLPRRLFGILHKDLSEKAAWIASVVLAQAVFALCHFRPAALLAQSLDSLEAGRLFVAGLLYWIITDTNGVWAAAGLHAALNALTLARPSSQPSFSITVVGVGCIALLALYLRATMNPLRHSKRCTT